MVENYGFNTEDYDKLAAIILTIDRVRFDNEDPAARKWNVFFSKLNGSSEWTNFKKKYWFDRPNHDQYTESYPQTAFTVHDAEAFCIYSFYDNMMGELDTIHDFFQVAIDRVSAYFVKDSSKIGSGGEIYSCKAEHYNFSDKTHFLNSPYLQRVYSWKKEKRSARTGDYLQNEGWYKAYETNDRGHKVPKMKTTKYSVLVEAPDRVIKYEDFINLDKKAFVEDFFAVVEAVVSTIETENAERDHDTELCKGLHKSLWTSGYGDLVKVLGSEERCKEFNKAKSDDTDSMRAAFTVARAGIAPRGWVPSSFRAKYENDYTADEWRRIELYSRHNGYDDSFEFNKNNIYITRR